MIQISAHCNILTQCDMMILAPKMVQKSFELIFETNEPSVIAAPL
tara:strand:+ start:257 stop:391 length:135 start_codon:yes stop_codon:yes gene_type:complete